MADLILFGTEGCHLCEEAEQLLIHIGLDFEKVDIINSEQHQQHYAIRIPVLLHPVSGLELGWPFSEEMLRAFVGNIPK